jgi:hypothetical protein
MRAAGLSHEQAEHGSAVRGAAQLRLRERLLRVRRDVLDLQLIDHRGQRRRRLLRNLSVAQPRVAQRQGDATVDEE